MNQRHAEIILEEVGHFYGVDPHRIKMRMRNRELSAPRNLSIELIKDFLDPSLRELGKFMGGRHNTTLNHYLKNREQRTKENEHLIERVRNRVRVRIVKDIDSLSELTFNDIIIRRKAVEG